MSDMSPEQLKQYKEKRKHAERNLAQRKKKRTEQY
jgi:hypothetical protein